MSTLTNDDKSALLARAIEVQERADWTTGEWVVWKEAQKMFSHPDDVVGYEAFATDISCLLNGKFKECAPATTIEAVESTCLEGAVLVAAYERGDVSDTTFYNFMSELGEIAGLGDVPNGWNDSTNGAGSKENVVAFLRHAKGYYDGEGNEPLLALTQGYRDWLAAYY